MKSPLALLFLMLLPLTAIPQAPPTASPSFEVASVRLSPTNHGFTTFSPSGAPEFRVTSASMLLLIDMAFDAHVNQTVDAPAWAENTFYDISAKPGDDTALTYKQLEPYLQTLLKERFHLQTHFEQREVSGYTLVIAKGGSKLQPAKNPISSNASLFSEGLRGSSIPMATLSSMLAGTLNSFVVDKTGLAGNFDVTLKFANPNSSPADTAADSTLPSIFTAVTEQLGLRLNREKVLLDFLVVEHVDKLPTEN